MGPPRGDGIGISLDFCSHLSHPQVLYSFIAPTQELAAAPQILMFSYEV